MTEYMYIYIYTYIHIYIYIYIFFSFLLRSKQGDYECATLQKRKPSHCATSCNLTGSTAYNVSKSKPAACHPTRKWSTRSNNLTRGMFSLHCHQPLCNSLRALAFSTCASLCECARSLHCTTSRSPPK